MTTDATRRDFVEVAEDLSASPLWNPDLAPTPLEGWSAPLLLAGGAILGCFPWTFTGGEAAFARIVAFSGSWTP